MSTQPTSLAKIYNAHRAKQTELRDTAERLRKRVLESVPPATDALLESVNSGVTAIFANQRELEAEARKLQAEAARFSKQTKQWVAVTEQFNRSMKEIGDIENWARVMEQDITAIVGVLEAVSKPPKLP